MLVQVRLLRTTHKEASVLVSEVCELLGAQVIGTLVMNVCVLIYGSSNCIEELNSGQPLMAVRHGFCAVVMVASPLVAIHVSSLLAHQVRFLHENRVAPRSQVSAHSPTSVTVKCPRFGEMELFFRCYFVSSRKLLIQYCTSHK